MTNQNQLAPASILDVAQQERNKLDVAKPDAQVMLQVQTARAFPRSIKSAMQEARSMATLDRETAGSCFYKIPRAGKMIEGPSIRLAEIMASAWGNLAIQGSIDEVTAASFGICNQTCLGRSNTDKRSREKTGGDIPTI